MRAGSGGAGPLAPKRTTLLPVSARLRENPAELAQTARRRSAHTIPSVKSSDTIESCSFRSSHSASDCIGERPQELGGGKRFAKARRLPQRGLIRDVLGAVSGYDHKRPKPDRQRLGDRNCPLALQG